MCEGRDGWEVPVRGSGEGRSPVWRRDQPGQRLHAGRKEGEQPEDGAGIEQEGKSGVE